jgi:hypothetical protein
MLDGVRYPDIRISTLAGRSPGPSLRHSEVVINLANSFMATLAAVDPDPQVALGAVFLDQLRTFIAAVDEGSFSAAAPKLLRARSMVSETVSNLEEQIGVLLFDRSGRYPKLIPAGVVLLADARNIITQQRPQVARRRDSEAPAPPKGLSGRPVRRSFRL